MPYVLEQPHLDRPDEPGMAMFSDAAIRLTPEYLKFEDVAYVAVGDPHTTTLAKYLDLP